MTNQEQTDHWLKFHRYQTRYENLYTPRFNKAILEQHEQFISTGTLMAVTSAPIYKVLHSLYMEAAYIWAHRATANLRKERLTMGFSERIIELMRQYYGIDLLNLSENISQTTKDIVQRVLTDAAQEGFGFDEVVKRLRATDLRVRRARLIARTETVGASNAASNAAAQDSGLLMDKIWISARDNRVRLHHAEVNQHQVSMDQTFTVGFVQMQFPGDKAGGPKEVCNCFLPDQLTAVNPEIIKKAFRSFYDGQVITIKGSNNKTFTCTPNHPILTTKGFIAAGKLTKSDKLVYSNFIDNSIMGKLNVNNGIATFEEVYNSMAELWPTVRECGSIMDFYGDGSDRDINIVCSLSHLLNRRKGSEAISNDVLEPTDYGHGRLFENCSLIEPIHVPVTGITSHNLISFKNQLLPISKRSLSHTSKHTFASVPYSNSGIFESESNNIPATSEMISDSFNRFTGIKHLNSEWNINNCGDITKLSHSIYKGFVYTFETTAGVYDINSFVAKNCRCTHAFIPRRDANGRLVRAH